MDEKRIKAGVREIYEEVADRGTTSPPGLGLDSGRTLALRLGYPETFLDSLDGELLELFAGCGFPHPEKGPLGQGPVLDLGCGAGLDALFAARRLGENVVGVDLTLGLLRRGRAYLQGIRETRVLLVNGDLGSLPLASGLFQLALGNCVFSIVFDKGRALGEVLRVLRPGGTLIFCDLAAKEPLPPELKEDPAAWAFCTAGALEVAGYTGLLEGTGFVGVDAQALEDHGPFASYRFQASKPR